jgi:para-nitrobenzyl esterase
MQNYFVNFIKTGNPNGNNLPNWPATKNSKPVSVMRIDVKSAAVIDKTENRFKVLEQIAKD